MSKFKEASGSSSPPGTLSQGWPIHFRSVMKSCLLLWPHLQSPENQFHLILSVLRTSPQLPFGPFSFFLVSRAVLTNGLFFFFFFHFFFISQNSEVPSSAALARPLQPLSLNIVSEPCPHPPHPPSRTVKCITCMNQTLSFPIYETGSAFVVPGRETAEPARGTPSETSRCRRITN